MQISSNANIQSTAKAVVPIKTVYTEKISKDEAREIKEQITQNANAIAFNSASMQNSLLKGGDTSANDYESFQSFLKEIGYDGKPIASLTQDEASELVSKDGFFGVDQTSKRISDFVINGAGGDEKMLRAGREGMLRGFKEAEEMWGGKLPDISQETMKRATEMVDKAIQDLGFSIIDKEA
ncbi:MAG: hypothetical protein PHI38_03220 [Sulfurimonas sp.]|jgi:ribosomal protein L7/L12|uniref:hypothetical protein n=1 Tax=Sulfurimonas sp. TaxID=2022749 RepID=UPI002622ECEE|nr:hypothetical protein [Sulfurimonas sp.]MDD3475855.1 hypothetical protein [Sulfurimonas sp.]